MQVGRVVGDAEQTRFFAPLCGPARFVAHDSALEWKLAVLPQAAPAFPPSFTTTTPSSDPAGSSSAIRAVGMYFFLISLAPIALDGDDSFSSPGDAMPANQRHRTSLQFGFLIKRLTAPDRA